MTTVNHSDTGAFLAYPRLPTSATLVRLHEMRNVAEQDPAKLADLIAFEHPLAQPVPTGASLASVEHIHAVRNVVTSAIARWLNGKEIPRAEALEFDIILGKALHDSLQIMPADAGHEETWNFIGAVIFPDVIWARFPTLHEDRVLGRPRNVIRRAWHRHDMIGDLQTTAARPLGEDELTAIFERTAVASNRRLARAIAENILSSSESNRSEFTRRMTKQVTKMTGPLLLDTLETDELRELVAVSARGLSWPDPDERRQRGSSLDALAPSLQETPSTEETAPAPIVRARATGDLVRQFHEDMVTVAVESKDALGYRPTALIGLIYDLGGVEAARRLVGSDHPSTTFTALWECGRLDLTVEALILEPAFAGLFGSELMERAEFRLREHS